MLVSLKTPRVWLAINIFLVLLLGYARPAITQSTDASGTQTMRPVIRGRQAAVSSMRAPATEAARQILQAGGNAFDAAVAGQAALGVTDFADNGVGSDTVVLVYVAGEKKVHFVNAGPSSAEVAALEW